MANEYKRLYRSVDDRMIAGVCGGIADYFDVDSTLIRLLFVFGFFASVSGLFWAYLIMMIIVPESVPAGQDVVTTEAEDVTPKKK
ncbi:MAG: PspC domain-containing protein [Anaerolineales bacterium]|nr:PspC domain-containing protein [Anaerolineales bacterium]